MFHFLIQHFVAQTAQKYRLACLKIGQPQGSPLHQIHKIFKTLWVSMVVCLFLGSAPCLQAQTPFTFRGIVLDADSLDSVPNATVSLSNGKVTTTNQKGEFSFQGDKEENITISIDKFIGSNIGYSNMTQEIVFKQYEDALIFKIHKIEMLYTNCWPGPERGNLISLGEVILGGTRLDKTSSLAYTNVAGKELKKQNLGQDLPILLNFTPSVVTTSDAGAGVGYTGIRVRGSDATRTNITINGIPYNDSESQGTFWVNMPDFASSVSSIQIQRGVGTSTNGAGAFGASVNIQTNQKNEKPYLEFNNSAGSFRTLKNTLMLGTGLLAGKFTVDARLSNISSNGFIDRANSHLKSFYVSGAYYGKRSTLRANVFSGAERTYQAWYGVPEARLRGDVAGMQAYIERNYLPTSDSLHLLQSGNRTYNPYKYDNQTDNYQQDHYQLFYS